MEKTKQPHTSNTDMKKEQYSALSFELMKRKVPASIAFPIAHTILFLRGLRQKPVRIDHYKTIKKQLEQKLNTGFFAGIDLRQVEDSDNLPEDINYDHIRMEVDNLISNGYSYLAKTHDGYFMVRTNQAGHKVSKIKRIF